MSIARLPEQLLVSEAAPILRVHPKTLYREIRRGNLRAKRIGSAIRISRQELERYLADTEQQAS